MPHVVGDRVRATATADGVVAGMVAKISRDVWDNLGVEFDHDPGTVWLAFADEAGQIRSWLDHVELVEPVCNVEPVRLVVTEVAPRPVTLTAAGRLLALALENPHLADKAVSVDVRPSGAVFVTVDGRWDGYPTLHSAEGFLRPGVSDESVAG